jgi:Fe/S biogenesis protein NfuA
MAEQTQIEGGPVVTFTDTAQERILQVLEGQKLAGRAALRIAIPGRGTGGWDHKMSMVEDGQPKPDDTVVDVGAFKVFVDPETLPRLRGANVDYVEQLTGGGFQIDNPNPTWSDPLAAGIQELIDERVNPSVAGHGGHVDLIDVKDNRVYVQLGGGCQGCGMVDVTLRQGIEVLIRERYPQIEEVIDTTDHAGGTNPYFQPAKGMGPEASPMYQPSKG